MQRGATCRSREDAPLRPASPYAVSKVAQGYLALQYALVPRPARRPHAHLPPHRPRPRRGLRGELVRAPDRGDRGRPAAARALRGQPGRGARLHRRARRGARVLAAAGARRSRARSTTSAAGAGVRIGDLLRPAVDVSGRARSRSASTPSAAPVRHPRPGRRPREAPRRHRLGAATSRCERTLADLLDDWRGARGPPAPPCRARVEGPPHRGHRVPGQERGPRASRRRRPRAAPAGARGERPRGAARPASRSCAAT